MASKQLISFSICRFVPDPLRDEGLNVGVIAVSDEDQESAGAFNLRFKSRLEALGTTARYKFVRKAIESIKERTGPTYQGGLAASPESMIRNSGQLDLLARTMTNQIQFTTPRPFRAETLSKAVAELYAVFVSPQRRPASSTETKPVMSIEQLRKLIRETIRNWGGPSVTVQEKTLEKANSTRHLADFWLESGKLIAAFVAIPEDPGDRFEAWARRDSIPTIADAFMANDPNFKTVAVLPPNGHIPSEFVRETQDFLSERKGVLVVHADQLEDHRKEIVAAAI